MSNQRPLRIVSSGTLFVTHTLGLPTYPAPAAVNRAHSVNTTRGGSASSVSSLLAQFPFVDAMLVAPLGGNSEGQMILRDLEKEGVNTRYCKIWERTGVPSAWVLQADDTDVRTVINHNPLPDITHEEFASLLGPLLVPENYLYLTPPVPSPNAAQSPPASAPATVSRPSYSRSQPPSPLPTQPRILNPNSPAPFEWIHFEGRSVKTTLQNMTGLDGLARERKWRNHCVFSVDMGRRTRQGVEALLPHADIIFLNKHYAQAHSPHYSATPRAFLLSMTSLVPQHALLVAHWGSEGSALLSLPTREYFQSSGWAEENTRGGGEWKGRPGANGGGQRRRKTDDGSDTDAMRSVRTGSDFWAGSHTTSSTTYSAGGGHSSESSTGGFGTPFLPPTSNRGRHSRSSSSSSENTEIAANERRTASAGAGPSQPQDANVIDEVGAQDAFVAGMIFALSRRIVPGAPFTPPVGRDGVPETPELEKGKWRLEECLRFATELAGRKARRRGWENLADEMFKAGWFDV